MIRRHLLSMLAGLFTLIILAGCGRDASSDFVGTPATGSAVTLRGPTSDGSFFAVAASPEAAFELMQVYRGSGMTALMIMRTDGRAPGFGRPGQRGTALEVSRGSTTDSMIFYSVRVRLSDGENAGIEAWVPLDWVQAQEIVGGGSQRQGLAPAGE